MTRTVGHKHPVDVYVFLAWPSEKRISSEQNNTSPTRGTIMQGERMAAHFEGQREDEVVLEVFRRHPIAMRKGFYMLLIPLTIGAIPPLIWPERLELFLLPLVAFALGMVLFFYQWMGWYFTVFILTDQRLRQVTQRGFFGKSVIDLGISKILNISYNVPGLAGELFGFGTIVIQTYVGDLILDRIHHPEKVYTILQDVVATTTYKREDNEATEEVV